MGIASRACGVGKDGSPVRHFSLSNDGGIEVELISWGATVVRVRAPDRVGRVGDIALGSDDPGFYQRPHPHLGSTIGRYANRIAGARFSLDGVEYRLPANVAPNHLHGGARSFHDQPWTGEEIEGDGLVGVRFRRTSPDGEQGYPGALDVSATYTLDRSGALGVEFRAITTRPTVVNLAQHAYWNLRDGGASDVLGHELWLGASRYTVVGDGFIPTGELRAVHGTPLDFTKRRPIGEGGYDHNYVLDGSGGFRWIAHVVEPETGRSLEVGTTQPGVQLYTGNFLDGSLVGRDGVAYRKHAGLCLETQHFPDSPNQPSFPSTVLRPGQLYLHRAVYRLGVVR